MRISDWSSDVCSSDLHAEAGDGGYSLRIDGTTEGTYRRGTIVGGAAAGTAHQFRSGDDRRDGQLRGHRELFAFTHWPPARLAAAHLGRISSRKLDDLCCRVPSDRSADRN